MPGKTERIEFQLKIGNNIYKAYRVVTQTSMLSQVIYYGNFSEEDHHAYDLGEVLAMEIEAKSILERMVRKSLKQS